MQHLKAKGSFGFFSYSYGDMIYANYINDRFSEYKETIVTLFNKILKRTTTRTDCGGYFENCRRIQG